VIKSTPASILNHSPQICGTVPVPAVAMVIFARIGFGICVTFDPILKEMLWAAIELLTADKGTIQLFDASRKILTIAAHQGFDHPFLSFFKEVSAEDASVCGQALRRGSVSSSRMLRQTKPMLRPAPLLARQATALCNPPRWSGRTENHWGYCFRDRFP
jgi:hypothetical protein